MEIALDAIGYSKALQKAGMPREQADIIARTQEARLDAIVRSRNLATKQDLEILRSELRQDLAEMEVRITKAFHNALFGFVAAIAAVAGIAGAVFTLIK